MALRAIQFKARNSSKIPRNRSLTPGNRSGAAIKLSLELRRLAKRKKKAYNLLRLAHKLRNAKIKQLNQLLSQKQLEQKKRSKELRKLSLQRFRKLLHQINLEMDKEMVQTQNSLTIKKRRRQYIKMEIKKIKKLAKKSPQTWAHFRSYIKKIEMAFAGIVPLEEALKKRPIDLQNADRQRETKMSKKDSKISSNKFQKIHSEVRNRSKSPTSKIIQGPYSVPKPLNFKGNNRTHSSTRKLGSKASKQKADQNSQLSKLRDGLRADSRMIRHLEKSLISVIRRIEQNRNQKEGIRSENRSHTLSSNRSKNRSKKHRLINSKIVSQRLNYLPNKNHSKIDNHIRSQSRSRSKTSSKGRSLSRISRLPIINPNLNRVSNIIQSSSNNPNQIHSKINIQISHYDHGGNFRSLARSENRLGNRIKSFSQSSSLYRNRSTEPSKIDRQSRSVNLNKNAYLRSNKYSSKNSNKIRFRNQSYSKKRSTSRSRDKTRIKKSSRVQRFIKGFSKRQSNIYIISHIESKTSNTNKSTHIPAAIRRRMALDEKKVRRGEEPSIHFMKKALRKSKKNRRKESSSEALGIKEKTGISMSPRISIESNTFKAQKGVLRHLKADPTEKQTDPIEDSKSIVDSVSVASASLDEDKKENLMKEIVYEDKVVEDKVDEDSKYKDNVDDEKVVEDTIVNEEDQQYPMSIEQGAGDGFVFSQPEKSKWRRSHRNTAPTRLTHDLVSGAHDSDLHELVGEQAGELKKVFSLLMQDKTPTHPTDLLLLKRYSSPAKGYDDTLQKLHHRRLSRCTTVYEKILNEADFEGLKKQMDSRMRRVLRSPAILEPPSHNSSSSDELQLSLNNGYDIEGMLRSWQKFFNGQTKTPFQLELERKHQITLRKNSKNRKKQRSFSRSKSPRRSDLEKHFSHPRLTARQQKVERLISQSLHALRPMKNYSKCSICGLSQCSSISDQTKKTVSAGILAKKSN
ncbi:micronuclear linker histone polyprotein-like [Drosophila takahashii]|uniref:micronuclear linker histone polyprotein-like n=1 Tax=Drosophila takahashii TaxID=29030 RepID=UPI0038996418